MNESEAPFGTSSSPDITLEELGRRMDVLGQQMNWLCENLTSLFAFVNQMGQSGGGLRGMIHMLKSGAPELNSNIPVEGTDKIGVNQ